LSTIPKTKENVDFSHIEPPAEHPEQAPIAMQAMQQLWKTIGGVPMRGDTQFKQGEPTVKFFWHFFSYHC
jgi:hypothetical protein